MNPINRFYLGNRFTPKAENFLVTPVPLSFEQNLGQTDDQVDFLARGSGYSVFLTGGDAVLSLGDADQGHVVRLDLIGSDSATTATGSDLLPGTSNYLVGSNPDKEAIRSMSALIKALNIARMK